jgi:hypothetical protein
MQIQRSRKKSILDYCSDIQRTVKSRPEEKELTRVLDRLARFWENIALLTESRAELYEDTQLKFKKQKNTILEYIENSKFRVPTMGLVIPKANFFLSIAKGVTESLKTNGNEFYLQYSEIRKDDKTVLDEQVYLRYFLDAAQRSNNNRTPRHVSRDHEIGKRKTSCRRVIDSANFWKCDTPTPGVFLGNLCATESRRSVVARSS